MLLIISLVFLLNLHSEVMIARLGVRGAAWLVVEGVTGTVGGQLLASFSTILVFEQSSTTDFTFSFGVSHRGSTGGCSFLRVV